MVQYNMANSLGTLFFFDGKKHIVLLIPSKSVILLQCIVFICGYF